MIMILYLYYTLSIYYTNLYHHHSTTPHHTTAKMLELYKARLAKSEVFVISGGEPEGMYRPKSPPLIATTTSS